MLIAYSILSYFLDEALSIITLVEIMIQESCNKKQQKLKEKDNTS